ncbi:amino acid adenylation domain-containing protein [Tumebacillus lipolyticus]|uniref:Amino acid adenylation domain-containing protein n=1 Tax=Tumebacillus lipolyticus TaxID=1280370 RepID=A0ABW4ZXZ0_9BACL
MNHLEKELTIQRKQYRDTGTLSSIQNRMWFIDQLQPGHPMYNTFRAMRLQGELDLAALTRSLEVIVERHEMLRAAYRSEDGVPVQVIASELQPQLSIMDLSAVAEAEREAQLERMVTEVARRPFDLGEGPVFTFTLFKLAEREHVLVFIIHHIIFDGWSLGVFCKELCALYSAFATGQEPQLAALPIQYPDYAVWHNQFMESAVVAAQLDFWKQHLEGAPPFLKLPTDRSRPAVQTFDGVRYSHVLPPALVERLKSLRQEAGVTMNTALLAVYNVLLYRYSGQQDIVVGSPVAGRNQEETHGLIGCFVNTVALRTQLSGEMSFRELLSHVDQSARASYANGELPFDKLVEELQQERDPSYSPVFQVMFLSERDFTKGREMPGLSLTQYVIDNKTAKTDLTLWICQEDRGLVAKFEYNTDLFDELTIVRMAQHFEQLLEAAVADPERSIATLPLLSEAEQRQVVFEWNETATEVPPVCLHHLFEAQAARTPHHVAAIYGEESMTYAQLEAQANQLAYQLRALGVGPDVPVGLCLDRSLDMVVALIGILKAGGAYLPLDTDAPMARIRQVLEDAQAPVCVAHSSLLARLPEGVVSYVLMDRDAHLLAEQPTTAQVVAVTPEHLVSIYYTSGSTGKPKGVSSTHQGWVNRMIWMQRAYQLEAQETVLQKTTLTFDDAACEFFWPLMVGARIALLEPGLHKDPRAILDAAIRYQAAFLTFVPSMLALFVDAVTQEDREQLKCLRHVGSSGEALRSDLVRNFQERVGCSLHNTWGATEVSIDSTIHTCTEADAFEAEIVSVGRPIDNNRCYVLDEHLQPVPVGVAGDLYLAGIGLARDYLNDPERTREAFLPDPFFPGERMYKTGDRGYLRKDGCIMFLGRRDDQVKVRGQRVELAEIEAVLATHPSLQICTVVAFKRPDGYRLAAYYVLRDGEQTTSEALRAYLAERLPDYMVPWRFFLLEHMPTTISGKIDRKQLPDPGDDRPDLQTDFIEPSTAVEQQIAVVWQEILGVDRVGLADSFFHLGGHSLHATRIISRINREFQTRLPLRVFFEEPTIGGLARRVEQEQSCAGSRNEQGIPRLPRQAAYELSNAQQRLWFQYQYDAKHGYGFTLPYLIEGPLCRQSFAAAFAAVVARHSVMRTTYEERVGIPYQIVQDDMAIPCQFHDLTGRSEQEQWAALAEFAAADTLTPYDLSTGPLFRMNLFALTEQQHMMVLSVYQIAYDGWTAGVFMKDLRTYYEALAKGADLPQLPPALQYVEYAAWQNNRLASGELDVQKAYWLQQLAGDVAAPPLPYDYATPPAEHESSRYVQLQLDAALTDRLKELSRAQGNTLYMTVMTGLKMWMAKVSGATDITLCVPLSARTHPDLDGLMGLLVNPVVMRTDLTDNPSFAQALERVTKSALGAYANQDYPFDYVLNELRALRGSNVTPYSVVFVGQNAHSGFWELDEGVHVRVYPLEKLLADQQDLFAGLGDDLTVQFDLHMEMIERDGVLTFSTQYHPLRFRPETVEQFLQQLQHVLSQMVADPHLRLSQIQLFESEELDLDDLF